MARDWRLLVVAVFVSFVVTAVCSLGFFAIRWFNLDRPLKRLAPLEVARSPLYVSFGTELFALLFAVDLCVMGGFIEVWKLREFPYAEQAYRGASFGFLLLVAFLCLLSLRYERLSYEAWMSYTGYTASGPGWWFRIRHLPPFIVWWVRASVVRWFVSTVHLACIFKLARYDWIARMFPWLAI